MVMQTLPNKLKSCSEETRLLCDAQHLSKINAMQGRGNPTLPCVRKWRREHRYIGFTSGEEQSYPETKYCQLCSSD